MAKTVFILGAGASRDAGGPLIFDFIARAIALHRRNGSAGAHESFERVFTAREKLQRAAVKSHINFDNMEEVFAAFEMAELIGSLADLGTPENFLIRPMRDVIVRTLEASINFQFTGKVEAPSPYDGFAHLLKRVHESPLLGPVAVVSFNYDLALEYALKIAGVSYDYCLAPPSPRPNTIGLLKLHGSLNWKEETEGIRALEVYQVADNDYLRDLQRISMNSCVPIDTATLLRNPSSFSPLLVPPTSSKASYQKQLKAVWVQAAEELGEAENIVMIGYSMPPTDVFFRHFFALSTISDVIIERFILVDPSDKVKEHLQDVLSSNVLNRPGVFEHIPKGFSLALSAIAGRLNLGHVIYEMYRNRAAGLMFNNKYQVDQATRYLTAELDGKPIPDSSAVFIAPA